MDGNKDDASRCLRIAEDAIVSGDKERALKFINMAKRLNPSLSVDELVAACDNLDSVSRNSSVSEKLKETMIIMRFWVWKRIVLLMRLEKLIGSCL